MADEEEVLEEHTPHIVVPAPPQELTAPVIDHATKIAHMEERQAQHEAELVRQISELEQRLAAAQAANNSELEERLSARLASVEAAASRAAQAVEEAPEEVEELAEDAVEVPRVKTEKPRGIHGRRKARRNK